MSTPAILESPPTGSRANQSLWAITSYFNPAGYRRRLANYRVFRRHLPLPLLTVELALAREAELGKDDADILVELRAGDVMWQKERLLNIALEHLPISCREILWIDCDLVYTGADWPSELSRRLRKSAVVHAFRRVLHLRRDAALSSSSHADVIHEDESFGARLAAGGEAAFEELGQSGSRLSRNVARGHCWAARRDVLERAGIYDACIIGGGDRAFAGAACGRPELTVRGLSMGPRAAQHYLVWAARAASVLGGEIAFLDSDILHLWHGDLLDRQSAERQLQLAGFGFDPHVDIALDPARCWRWSSDKPDLHAWVRSYFESRREDG